MGTPEAQWLLDRAWDSLPAVGLAGLAMAYEGLVVVAAHPDDETLGVGGVIASLADMGVPTRLIVATAGERSHPDATQWQPGAVANVRQDEVAAAMRILAPQATVTHLGLPDGGLADSEEELTAMVGALLHETDLVLAPWIHDGHADHDAAGRAVRRATATVGCRALYYPVWMWHWAVPEQFPWECAAVVELSIEALTRKSAALQCFPSQTSGLGPLPGDAPVITGSMLERGRRLIEVVLTPDRPSRPHRGAPVTTSSGAPSETFDAMYDGDTDDPWGFEDSFYEERKRMLTLAVLGRERYRNGLEIGCATGRLTQSLAERVDCLTGMDISAAALRVAARRRFPGSRRSGTVSWKLGGAPEEVPAGPFDLIVMSEVGYFLSPRSLLATLRRVRGSLASGGEIVLVDWRHPTRDIPLNGDLVHRQATSVFDLPHRVAYRDADCRIDVWGSPVSVAAEESLADGESRLNHELG
ncbi:MAG: PIG-L family deacetylase [Dermatophilaceae bacterium]